MTWFRRSPESDEAAPTVTTPDAPHAQQEVELLRRTINAIPLGVVVCDAAGERLVQNEKALSFQGDYLVDPLLKAAVDDAVGRANDGDFSGETIELPGTMLQAFEIVAKPLPGHFTVVTIEDTSERRRLDAIRRDFVANVSHELRTPIGALVLLTESLREEHDENSLQRINDHIAAEAARAARLVEELLALSRLETPRTMDHDPVDVKVLVDAAQARVGALAAQRHVTVSVEVIEGVVVTGDMEDLLSAIVNLLENAVKYSDDGSAVTLRVQRLDGLCEITVCDSGIGIPAADLERVFERFYRVDRARSRDTGGSGLGLAIVRHVVANHGGEVTVSSREGEGSVFTIRLPLAA